MLVEAHERALPILRPYIAVRAMSPLADLPARRVRLDYGPSCVHSDDELSNDENALRGSIEALLPKALTYVVPRIEERHSRSPSASALAEH